MPKARKAATAAPPPVAPKKTVKKASPVPSKARTSGANPTRAWVEKMNKTKRYEGKAQIRMASEVRTPYSLRRPTGILGLDIELGGGLHAGGPVEIHGSESVGKTFLAFTVAANVQKNYGENASILIYSTEIRTDKGFARMAEFCVAYSEKEIEDFDELRQAQGLEPFTKEDKEDLRKQIGEVVVLTADTADTGLDAVIDALEAGHFQLIIIESLGALLTKKVEEGSVGDDHYAGPSKLVTQFQNKVYPLYMMDRPDGSMLETTILGINQARSNIGGGKYDSKKKAALGTFAWKHGQLVSIELERGAGIRASEEGPAVGRTVRWKFTKGKAGTHDGKKGEYDFHNLPRVEPVFWRDVETTWYGGIAVFDEMVMTAKRLGVATVAGSWVTWGERRFQGMSKFAQSVAEDPALQDELRKDCIKKAGLLVKYC